MLVGFARHIELALMLVLGRTGVVPPFVSLDHPPLQPSHTGQRPVPACTPVSCRECDKQASNRLKKPPIPQQWNGQGKRGGSVEYFGYRKLGAISGLAEKYEAYVGKDVHDNDVPALPDEHEMPEQQLKPPLKPKPHVFELTATSFRAFWKEPTTFGSVITRYEVQLTLAPGEKCSEADYIAERCKILDSVILEPEIRIQHISEGQQYRLRVRAENEAGWGEFSDSVVIDTPLTLPTGAPPAPKVEVSNGEESSTAAVQWDLPEEDHGVPPDMFEVETRASNGIVLSVISSQHLFAKVKNLPRWTSCSIRVRAHNHAGWSEYGPPAACETL
mmetsp:Transcript_38294/g.90830  ORF Transcript_38294/g.90830 Transcript_38294/m.90830 type:complete len:331 (+) Transcript_38294:285-1277(+)